MSFSVDLGGLNVLKKSHGLGKDGRVQKYIDQEVVRRMAPFTPFDTGSLQNSAYVKCGEVIYTVPYAKFLYYGRAMVSPSTGSTWARAGEEKVVANRPLTFKGASMRGAYWFLRMKAHYGQEILKGAGKKIGK